LTTNPRGSPSNFHDDPDILARPEPDVKQTFLEAAAGVPRPSRIHVPPIWSIAVTGWPDDLIRRAARLIARQHRIRLPVVGDDGNLLGIVARVDALQALAR